MKEPLTGKVLVLGHDDRSFLSVVRSLGRAGLCVHVAWYRVGAPAMRSRYIRAAHDLPNPEDDLSGWFDAFLRLCRGENFDWILPTNDAAVCALHARRSELDGIPVHLPGPKTMELAFDKLATWELARSLAIPVPRQVHVRSARQDADRIAELGWPIVLKPRSSFAFGRLKWEHGVRKAYTPEELEATLATLLAKDEVLAQENHLGRGVGVEVLADGGQVLLAFQHARVHEPALGGGSSYRRSEPLDPELLSAARELVRAMQHTGVAMVEFKRDDDSGRFVLIEINARFWGSLPLSLAAGCDFPKALYELSMLGRREFPGGYREGLYARNLWMDFGWFLRNRRVDRSDQTLLRVGRRRLASELGHLVLGRERFDTWARDDAGPGWSDLARLRRELSKLARRKLRRLLSVPLRGRRARALRRELAAARRVLFVCKGNVCRSPFAAGLARQRMRGIEFDSAGTYQEPGRPAPVEARSVARDFGVDLSAHRSKTVTESDVEAADLVLTFDEANRHAMRTSFPEHVAKIRLMGELGTSGSLHVRDPYGGLLEDYRVTFRSIALRVEQVS